MPETEKITRNKVMHKRLKHYDVEFWANDFLRSLADVKDKQKEHMLIKMDEKNTERLIKAKKDAGKRLFLLDYDGTLVQFKDKPEYAVPDKELLELITRLAEDKKNTVVIISGRDRNTLEEWFGELKINLVAAHGMWVREEGKKWEQIELLSNEWKENIRPILEMHTARTPGSLVEEKEYSLAWHYRRCEPELAAVRVNELKDALGDLIGNLNIGLLSGNKVIEIKDTSVNKGRASSLWLNRNEWGLIFVAGDDWTDEDIFNILPDDAWSIKVGSEVSRARFRVDRTENVRELLKRLAEK